MFAADHDLWHPHFISRCVEVLERNSRVILCYSRTMVIDVHNNQLGLMPDQIDTRTMSRPARYNYILWKLGRCNMLYGVVRTDALKKVGKFKPILGSDLVVLAELALKGEFAQISEPLFFRRKNREGEDFIAYKKRIFSGSTSQGRKSAKKSRVQLYCELGVEHVKMLIRAPIPWRERIMLAMSTIHCFRQRWRVDLPVVSFLDWVLTSGKNVLRNLRRKHRLAMTLYNKVLRAKVSYRCPICSYYGPFADMRHESKARKHARCPRCGALERHRLQYLVIEKIFRKIDTRRMSVLHFAPENCLKDVLKRTFQVYITADLYKGDVDRKEDITHMSFADNSFDCIYASHVLEHIKDDRRALSEIRRVLKPGGIAILPVPVICEKTIEYDKPDSHEWYHVRRPGNDYYEGYKNYFSVVQLYQSSDFRREYQLYIHEERAVGSEPTHMPGIRYMDVVPVCYK